MKKLGPGYNEVGWCQQVQCVGATGRWGASGCGAPLEVTKDDLYLVHEHDIGGPRDDVRFTCTCGVESNMTVDKKFFADLPQKKDWAKRPVSSG